MDVIFLEGIDLFAFGGVSEAEREVGQRYSVDVKVEIDLRRAAVTDSLAETVSYVRLHEIVVATMKARKFELVESQAETIASEILDQTFAAAVSVRVSKLLPPLNGTVAEAGVEIRRTRK